MSNKEYLYEFDPSGTSPDNKITGEQHVLSPPDWMDYYFIIPKQAPFFREGLKVVHQNTGRVLVEGEDYHLTHKFMDATVGTAKAVFGSITLLDKSVTGAATVEYQTLGGIWMIDEQKILDILSNTKLNPRITTWEQVAGMPVAFPPIDHDWHLDDLIGMSEVVDALVDIKEALGGSDEPGTSHISRQDNPHRVTKEQVGLGSVPNYAVATEAESVSGARNDRFMTPLRVKQALESTGAAAVGNHLGDTDNPHRVTKEQVGLGLVDNYATANNDESVQGSSETLYMTPRGTREAIDQRVGNTLNTHTNDKGNPHEVTKTQVGLGNVQNYGVASVAEAETGTVNNKYMTPLRTMQFANAQIIPLIEGHTNRVDNPHGVTKAQVGLGNVDDFATATANEAVAGEANDVFMTPLRTRQFVESSVGEGLSGHTDLTNNPHGVTKAQVGLGSVQNYGVATETEAREGTATNKYMSPLRTAQAVQTLVGDSLEAHVNDTENPHSVTKSQVGLGNVQNYGVATRDDAIGISRNDRYMTPLRTYEIVEEFAVGPMDHHRFSTENPHDVTAEQVGAYDMEQTDALLEAKVDIASVVNNLTSSSASNPLSANQGRLLKSYIDNINAILQSDDTDLDELQEIVDFIKLNREELDSLSINNIAGLDAALNTKVDKVSGKGLSANDFTNALLTKLNAIEAGAQVNVPTNLTRSTTATAVTIASSTGSNASIAAATASAAGVMTAADRTKLDSIEEGAQANVPTNLGRTTSANGITVTSSTGSDAAIPAATPTVAGVMTAADKAKLDGIAAGAQVNVATNLGHSTTATTVTVTSSTGNNTTLPAATATAAGVFTSADKVKLDGIQAGAQANVATNLGIAGSGNNRTITSSTGSAVSVPVATTITAGFMSTTQVADLSTLKTDLVTLISELTTAFTNAANELNA